jgi:4-aminobutyrate aminotransferase/(S)-3-amino-2-methylpropionate transaminase
MIAPPSGWLATVAAVARREGGLLIHDEIFTGMGRTGKWLAASPVVPDLVCLGKALGGGYPISACFGSQEVMSAWPKNQGEAIHTGTFFGYPLSARMALATLATIEQEHLLDRVKTLGQKFVTALRESLAGMPLVKQVRGEGLFIAIEGTKPLAGAKLMDLLREDGIIALASGNHGEGLSVTPAFTIPEDVLMSVIEPIRAAIAKL